MSGEASRLRGGRAPTARRRHARQASVRPPLAASPEAGVTDDEIAEGVGAGCVR